MTKLGSLAKPFTRPELACAWMEEKKKRVEHAS
jgi:hypothetical protein